MDEATGLSYLVTFNDGRTQSYTPGENQVIRLNEGERGLWIHWERAMRLYPWTSVFSMHKFLRHPDGQSAEPAEPAAVDVMREVQAEDDEQATLENKIDQQLMADEADALQLRYDTLEAAYGDNPTMEQRGTLENLARQILDVDDRQGLVRELREQAEDAWADRDRAVAELSRATVERDRARGERDAMYLRLRDLGRELSRDYR